MLLNGYVRDTTLTSATWIFAQVIGTQALFLATPAINLLDAVIDNTYFYTVHGIHRQVIGIPMGGSAFSLLATLYCSWRELLHVSAFHCRLNMFRYIDDLIAARMATDPSFLQYIDYGIDFGSTETGLCKAAFVGLPSVMARHHLLVRATGVWISTGT